MPRVVNRHPERHPDDLVHCATCGAKNVPYHKPRCAHEAGQRAALPHPLPMTCDSCQERTDTLVNVAKFRTDPARARKKVIRTVIAQVCPSCYYWRYGWDERQTPLPLEAVSA